MRLRPEYNHVRPATTPTRPPNLSLRTCKRTQIIRVRSQMFTESERQMQSVCAISPSHAQSVCRNQFVATESVCLSRSVAFSLSQSICRNQSGAISLSQSVCLSLSVAISLSESVAICRNLLTFSFVSLDQSGAPVTPRLANSDASRVACLL